MRERQNIAVPPPHPRLSEESWEDVQTRYGRVRNGLLELKRIIEESKPDALIVIGDDQNENYTSQNVPQFAIYTGCGGGFFRPALQRRKNLSMRRRDLANDSRPRGGGRF